MTTRIALALVIAVALATTLVVTGRESVKGEIHLIPVVEINLEPVFDQNVVGEDHTVTATLTDDLDYQPPGILVTFSVIAGPNTSAGGTCSVNPDCTTDGSGEVSFTYTGIGGPGTDQIEACFTEQPYLQVFCSEIVTKDWVPPVIAPLFLIIDEDSIDNGTSTIEAISFGPPFCGLEAGDDKGKPDVCINDDIASDGAGRSPACDANNPMILFSRPGPLPAISDLLLPTGQVGDEGLFSLITPSASFLNDYLDGCDLDLLPADPVSGFQGQLDPVAGFPLRNLQIEVLEGRTVCAVVHDSNVSHLEGNELNLQGNRLGLTAFDVTDVLLPPAGLPEAGSSSSLHVIEVDIINDPDQVLAICEGPLEFLPELPPD